MRSHTLPQLLLYFNNVCPDDYDDDDDDDDDEDDYDDHDHDHDGIENITIITDRTSKSFSP